MHKILTTERLTIRPLNLEDADFIIELVNTEGWLKYIGNRNINSKIEAEQYIQKIHNKPNFYYNIFELKTEKKAIGIITFLNRDELDFPDIGFALLPAYQKKGYTFEATKKYLDEVIKLAIYQNIIGITLPNNQKSIQLLQKLGLSYVADFKKDNETLAMYRLNPK